MSELTWVPALDNLDLLGDPVARSLTHLADEYHELAASAQVAEINPDYADTTALNEYYALDPQLSVNCVIVGGKRSGDERIAACMVRAHTRADVNRTVRSWLDVRKASFLPMERAVSETGMEYGAITAIGVPAQWAILIDSIAAKGQALIGSGVRTSKLLVPAELLTKLDNAHVIDSLGV